MRMCDKLCTFSKTTFVARFGCLKILVMLLMKDKLLFLLIISCLWKSL